MYRIRHFTGKPTVSPVYISTLSPESYKTLTKKLTILSLLQCSVNSAGGGLIFFYKKAAGIL
jgi:hypothetical protein